jgi:prepilin-type N-terminal cleavage/methylation domain-containing protein
MKHRKGFTLVELVVVILILAIISAIGGLVLHSYTLNRNLVTAARDIASDIAILKGRAVSENIQYQIAFDTTLPGSYTIQSVVNAVITNLTTKRPSSFGSGIRIISATFGAGGSQTVIFSPRGTVSPLGNAVLDGVVLQNSRNTQATITVNLTGRTYVTHSPFL